MGNLSLSIALEHYDRHIPWVEGTVKPKGIDPMVMIIGQDGDGGRRHERMLLHREFDVCELSLGSYVMARARGAALTAIPVFPRRLFSQSQMYVNTQCGINEPKDLIGKRVALRSFQTTLSVLAKGDLGAEYGVPLDAVTLVTTADEPVEFQAPPGITVERMDRGKKLGDALVRGEVSAFLSPRPPQPYLDGAAEVGRLFNDPRAEEVRYYQQNGFYPIMHVVAMKSEIAQAHPWVPVSLMDGFAQAKKQWERFMDDPNWSRLTWGRHYLEEERRVLGADPWPSGVASNRANLERFIGYEVEQGLIPEHLAVEDLFFETTLET
jgi:4,5-dihydroxyphthalate decarboxylase